MIPFFTFHFFGRRICEYGKKNTNNKTRLRKEGFTPEPLSQFLVHFPSTFFFILCYFHFPSTSFFILCHFHFPSTSFFILCHFPSTSFFIIYHIHLSSLYVKSISISLPLFNLFDNIFCNHCCSNNVFCNPKSGFWLGTWYW